MLVMSMMYMNKQSTWKKRESRASLDGMFKRSSGSSTRYAVLDVLSLHDDLMKMMYLEIMVWGPVFPAHDH